MHNANNTSSTPTTSVIAISSEKSSAANTHNVAPANDTPDTMLLSSLVDSIQVTVRQPQDDINNDDVDWPTSRMKMLKFMQSMEERLFGVNYKCI